MTSAPGPKILIVNADDFGMSTAVNDGIIQAHRDGIVTSTTLLANGSKFEEAVELSLANPRLGIGAHLNLVEGTPVLPAAQLPGLVDRHGQFLGTAVALWSRVVTGRVSQAILRSEIAAQLDRIIAAGIRPTHADSHMHAHALPKVMEAVVQVCREYGVERCRLPIEAPLGEDTPLSLVSRAKSRVIGKLAKRAQSCLVEGGILSPKTFVGPRFMGRLSADVLISVLRDLPDGVSELMCHPAVGNQETPHLHRDVELQGLVAGAVAKEARARGVRLETFAALQSQAA